MDVVVARAPARLDFGGGWTDVPPYSEERGGCVCNAAIELHAVATVRLRGPAATDFNADTPSPDNVLALAATRRAGMAHVHVDVRTEFPVGAGFFMPSGPLVGGFVSGVWGVYCCSSRRR